jgi:curved DNA-binding protein CbpA
MRSAYSVLGIHGNAKPGEIEIAFRTILATFTRDRLATEDGASRRLSDVEEAYKVLRSPDMRAAHDRRLAQAVSSDPVVSSWVEIRYPEPKESRAGRWAFVLVLATILAAVGAWLLER